MRLLSKCVRYSEIDVYEISNTITGHILGEGPRGAGDRITLQAYNETKKANIVIKTANVPVSQFRVNIHTIYYAHALSAPKMMLSAVTRNYRAFCKMAKVKQSKLGKALLVLHRPHFYRHPGAVF